MKVLSIKWWSKSVSKTNLAKALVDEEDIKGRVSKRIIAIVNETTGKEFEKQDKWETYTYESTTLSLFVHESVSVLVKQGTLRNCTKTSSGHQVENTKT